MIPARKSLGQHFLHSKSVLKQICEAAAPTADDVVLEIGPGKGALTETLLFFAGKVIAVEKDERLIEPLKDRFAAEIASGKLDILAQDILEFDPEVLRLYQHPYKLVANIPYYITGAIIEQFLTASYQPETIVLLVQKEVADRVAARDGKESILSLSVKAYGTPKYVAKVSKKYFRPMPAVDSAILLISDISRKHFASRGEEDRFFTLVRAGFAHKRKYVRSNLAGLALSESALALIPEKARAEDLPLSTWIALMRA